MKLSTLMLVISVLLFLGVLTVYDLSLREVYLKGTYKDRFGKHTFIRLDNIKELQLKSANLMGINIEHGEQEGIWISDRVKDQVKVDQKGEVVIVSVDVKDPKAYSIISGADVVLIVNKLRKLNTYNDYRQGQAMQYYNGKVNISGLTADNFDMVLSEPSNVILDGNKFGSFNSIVGGDKYWSTLTITSNNKIDTAYFDIKSKSSLELQNPEIRIPLYKFGDSSRIALWGGAARRLVH